MKKINLFLICTISIICCNQKAAAAPNFFTAPALFRASESSHQYLGLVSHAGTHQGGAGIEGSFLLYSDISILPDTSESLGVFSRINGIFFETDFGIPGEKLTAEMNLSCMYSAGNSNTLFYKYPYIFGNRSHNLRFGYTGYLTNDSTSQITGQLDYLYIKKRSAFMMNYENDTMFFYLTDKYRTAAFKFSWLYDLGENLMGLSVGFNLWAGERRNIWRITDDWKIEISDEAGRGNTAELFNAAEYSVDLVYLSFIFNNYSLSLGYDSELFKKLIHNNIHYVLNDAGLPEIDRPDRFYIAFKIGFPDDLF